MLIEPLLAGLVGHRFDAIVSRFAVLINRPRRDRADKYKHQSSDSNAMVSQEQSECKRQRSKREAVNRQRIEQHMHVFRIAQMLKERVHGIFQQPSDGLNVALSDMVVRQVRTRTAPSSSSV